VRAINDHVRNLLAGSRDNPRYPASRNPGRRRRPLGPQAAIGWTPVFPRAAAVVTDVGAPLSPAAIVARELGIPAVVGCGNDTMRLHTGDWVRVDGSNGTVEVLHQA
jgi:PEP-utilising enzyme, mobile domain